MDHTCKELALLVKKMREAQKGYFKADKNSIAKKQLLELSKKLEHDVDNTIENILDHQQKLF